jgi:hypothetical protein
MKYAFVIPAALAAVLLHSPAQAQTYSHRELHLTTRWKECSFQIDPALTQSAWHQFTGEAGLVTFFRPLADARPMGRGKYELSMLQWKTRIDDHDAAWNDTFVHPDSTHWLFEGSGLQFPGLMARAGIGEKTDVAGYFTKNPNANYGFWGAQVQRALIGGINTAWNASGRVSFVSMYGPEDLDFGVYGAEVIASRTIGISRWASLSPYAGVSGYLARSHEKTTAVSLSDENVTGARATLGASLRMSAARLGVEYSAAKIGSLSMKVGFAF